MGYDHDHGRGGGGGTRNLEHIYRKPTHLPRYQSPVGKGRSNEKKGVPKRCEMKKCHAILQSCKFSWSTSSGSPSEVARTRPKRSNIVRLCASEAPCDRPSVFNENAANELVISNSGHSAEMVARITSTQARIRSKCFGYAGWEGKALGVDCITLAGRIITLGGSLGGVFGEAAAAPPVEGLGGGGGNGGG